MRKRIKNKEEKGHKDKEKEAEKWKANLGVMDRASSRRTGSKKGKRRSSLTNGWSKVRESLSPALWPLVRVWWEPLRISEPGVETVRAVIYLIAICKTSEGKRNEKPVGPLGKH